MKQIKLDKSISVSDAAEHIKESIQEKGFALFCDIDHQANATTAGLDMPASRVLIFGNPIAGTKLMLKDITMSFDLPLRIAIIDVDGDTCLIHQTTEEYCKSYQVENHPVLEKVETLFSTLVTELS